MFEHQIDWSTRSIDKRAEPPKSILHRLFGEDAVVAPTQILCNEQDITDDDFKHLEAFPDIRILAINCPQITDDGLKHLGSLRGLRELSIGNNSNLTDAGLVHLQHLNSLETLGLQWLPNVSDGRASEAEASTASMPDFVLASG